MSLKELAISNNQVKTNMSCRVTVDFRDDVAKFCKKNDIRLADFMRYAITKTMKDESKKGKK